MSLFSIDADVEGCCGAYALRDRDGRNLLGAIYKRCFFVGVGGQPEPCDDKKCAIDIIDTYHGEEPSRASILRPSQLFEYKPGTDILLVGHAHPPLGRAVACIDASFRVGSLHKVVRAHGLRVWRLGAWGGLTPGPALPIREPVPLYYELAWGGQDLSDPAHPLGEPRNYVGRGIARNPKNLVDQPAAQLEFPNRPVGGRDNVPACFGAIHRHWQPRVSFAGTYDETWEATRMPLLPADFDPRFHVCVPHDQWSPTPLRSDVPIEVLGATPEGAWRFQLPRLAPGFSSYQDGKRNEHRTHLDTILIDADARRVELTYRAAIPLPAKWERLERVLVTEKQVV